MPIHSATFSMPNIAKLSVFAFILFFNAACSNNSGISDLEEFTQQTKSIKSAPIDPLPTIRPAEFFAYTAADIVSPFSDENVLPKQELQLEVDPVLPDQDRLRQPLEYFALDSLKMVGTLKQKNQIYGIIYAPDETAHRVSKGNFAGTQLGEIIQVTEGEIVLEETIKLKSGQWEKRKVSIALIEEK